MQSQVDDLGVIDYEVPDFFGGVNRLVDSEVRGEHDWSEKEEEQQRGSQERRNNSETGGRGGDIKTPPVLSYENRSGIRELFVEFWLRGTFIYSYDYLLSSSSVLLSLLPIY